MPTYSSFGELLDAWCPHVDDAMREALLEERIVIDLRQGEDWIAEGQPPAGLGLVSRGTLRHSFRSPHDQAEYCLYFPIEGEVCGTTTFLQADSPVSERIVALTPARIEVLPAPVLSGFIARHPQLQCIETRYARLFQDMANAHLLLLRACNAEARYRWICQHHPRWIKHVLLRDIANYLAITPETLSRVRRG